MNTHEKLAAMTSALFDRADGNSYEWIQAWTSQLYNFCFRAHRVSKSFSGHHIFSLWRCWTRRALRNASNLLARVKWSVCCWIIMLQQFCDLRTIIKYVLCCHLFSCSTNQTLPLCGAADISIIVKHHDEGLAPSHNLCEIREHRRRASPAGKPCGLNSFQWLLV